MKIATLFGIPIRLHWTFLPFLLLFVRQPWVLLAVFTSVLLHELGHSLMARRFGIRVIDITFWPLGGMARMNEIPEDSKVEGLVAIAGPAVNFVLAAISMTLLLVALVVTGGAPGAVGAAIGSFIWINLVLGTFNLLPAFPMDGGRLLRAWFGRTTDWVRATERAVSVGRTISFGMIAVPLLASVVFPAVGRALCMLPVIALFVWFAGGRELLAVRMRHGLAPFVGTSGFGPFTTVTPAQAAEWAERSAPYSGAYDASPQGPQRPDVRKPGSVGGTQRGFTQAEIDEMERYPGKWRRA